MLAVCCKRTEQERLAQEYTTRFNGSDVLFS